MTDAVEFDMYI